MTRSPLHKLPRWLRFTATQWLVLVLLVAATAAAAYWVQSNRAKRYDATATVLFRSAALDQTLFGGQVFSASADPERDAATNLQLIPTIALAQRVIAAGDLKVTPDEILANLSVGNVGPSDLAGITYTADTPEQAARVANLLATEFVSLRREVNRNAVEDAIRVARARVKELLDRNSNDPDLASESRRLDDLQVLAALQTGNVELTNPAIADATPVGASPRQVAIRAAVVQLLLVLAVFGIGRRLRDPVEDADDLEELEVPVLAELPRTKRIQMGSGARTSEAFNSGLRLLLGNLRFVATSSRSPVVVLQSTKSGEGKSTVAYHMARAASRAGTAVCLVDADLRSRAVTKAAGDPEGPGLSILLAGFDAADPIASRRMLDDALTEDADGFTLLGSGPQPPNPGDLLAREQVGQIIAALRDRFELVIIDAPPLMVVSDVAGLLPSSDAVVVVARRRAARLHQVKRLIDQLTLVGARPVGTILNLAPRDESGAYYYGGDKGSAARKAEARVRS